MELGQIRALFKSRKVCVLIPTFNNEQTLEKVITEVLQYTPDVIVVNDGSTDATRLILAKFPLIEKVSYDTNEGKGFALRTGFKRALGAGYDYVITIDSDGQHYASDLPAFLIKIETSPESIIIGARNMGQSTVPGKSSFGNKFSNFWFWVTTGLSMQDTQSGFRLYPVRRMRHLKFLTRKFEFEIEVLVRASWDGIGVEHVPVRVFYPERGKRISHFRPFRDVTRIAILNSFLVPIALFYIKPRDLWNNIKKKIYARSCENNSSTTRNQIRSKRFQ
ncbi:MAG: glycosyltransferase family 2 protein [Chryseolinea sp.]